MQLEMPGGPPPQPHPDPDGRPGPHSPKPDPIPWPPPKRTAYDIHASAPLEWATSEMFPGMISRKPTVHSTESHGTGFINFGGRYNV